MSAHDKVNILLVDDQPAKLLTYESILQELGENLLKANSAREAFEHLLKTDIAVVLVDVYMPDLDGFELARMVRDHPRFQTTAIIFISAVLLTDLDFLRGYQSGAVDYVPVPVVPEILRAKVKIFTELYRKTRQLEELNRELEARVAQRTAELEASTAELRESEERLRLAFDAAQMGWWDYNIATNQVTWSASLVRIMGFSPDSFGGTLQGALARVHPDDRERFLNLVRTGTAGDSSQQCELRFVRPDGSVRWSLAAGQVIRDGKQQPIRFTGVDLDITSRKEAEERQLTLVRELDHRAKNLLAVVQSVLHLSRADTIAEFVAAVDGRIQALSRAHTLLSEMRWQSVEIGRIVEEEIAPFATKQLRQIIAAGPHVALDPPIAQSMALALHELVTNAVKYGALSRREGRVAIAWDIDGERLRLHWVESGGPPVAPPSRRGFGIKVIVSSIERQLGGTVTFDWRSQGLDCVLAIPRATLDHSKRIANEADRGEPIAPKPISTGVLGRTILLAEDEALTAIMIREMLGELGYAVMGPVATLSEALAAAHGESIGGAILDVNLAGEAIYPVADALAARDIPFVFLTGYSAQSIDRGYAHVPILEKPVEPEKLRRLFIDGHAGGAGHARPLSGNGTPASAAIALP